MSTADRMHPGYQPNFDIDFAVGRQGELYVASIADALADGSGRVEVKTDEKALKYRRLYFEYGCKKFGGWAKSGIGISEAELWAHVIGGDTVLITPVERLRAAVTRLYRTENPYWRRECKVGSHPTVGIAIPFDNILSELFPKDVA